MKQNKPQRFAEHGQEELHSGKEYAPLHGSDSPDAFQQADGTGRHKKRRRPPLDENGKQNILCRIHHEDVNGIHTNL